MPMYRAKPHYKCELQDIVKYQGEFCLQVKMLEEHPNSKHGVGAVMVTSPVVSINFQRKLAKTRNSTYQFK